MYKLVIVDDERRIREGLKSIVDWQSMGFVVTEVFSDGRELIEILDYMVPDVILTDIKMNDVSGLEVAKFVYEHRIPSKVVLISGYHEFELACQGIKYGVEDYILKPTDVEKIEETFIKIKKQLDEEKKVQNNVCINQRKMDEALKLLEERFFADVVMGVVESEEYIRNCMALLCPGIEAEYGHCFIADIYIEDYSQFMELVWEYSYDQFEMNLKNFLHIYRGNNYRFYIVYKANNLIEILGIETKILIDSVDVNARVTSELERLLQEIQLEFNFKAYYKLRRVYKSIYEMCNLKEMVLEGGVDDSALWQRLEEQKKLLMSNITIGNVVTAQKLYHKIIQENNNLSIQEKNKIILNIMSTLNKVLWEMDEFLAKSLESLFSYLDILAMTKPQEIWEWSNRIFDRIKMENDNMGNSMISRAQNYIKENIYKDISQEEVANYLYICPSYLSRIFKKQTGETFLQYVTNVKMERAIELLRDPQYKSYQVGEMLGYKTPKYFARLFRAYTGLNPGEFRGKMLHLGERFEKDD